MPWKAPVTLLGQRSSDTSAPSLEQQSQPEPKPLLSVPSLEEACMQAGHGEGPSLVPVYPQIQENLNPQ